MLPLCIFDPDSKCDAHTIYITTVGLEQRRVNIAEEYSQKMHSYKNNNKKPQESL